MSRKLERSFVGHPSAILFLLMSRKRVFQQPQAITLKTPGWQGHAPARTRRPGPHPFMKCFSKSRFDRSAPSSVSTTDFALLTGSSM